jgi:hypothetical protein
MILFVLLSVAAAFPLHVPKTEVEHLGAACEGGEKEACDALIEIWRIARDRALWASARDIAEPASYRGWQAGELEDRLRCKGAPVPSSTFPAQCPPPNAIPTAKRFEAAPVRDPWTAETVHCDGTPAAGVSISNKAKTDAEGLATMDSAYLRSPRISVDGAHTGYDKETVGDRHVRFTLSCRVRVPVDSDDERVLACLRGGTGAAVGVPGAAAAAGHAVDAANRTGPPGGHVGAHRPAPAGRGR